MSEDILLSVENLTTKFETERGTLTAVDGISFDIREGEVFGVVGESGSGKSVTALSIMGLIDRGGTVDADSISFRGKELSGLSDAEMQAIRGGEISMIFQDPMTSLNPVISIGEQIAEVVRHHGDVGESASFWNELRRKYVTGTDPDSHSWQRAVELLETVGIPEPADRAHEYPHQLSGGMRQRVMIAQALAADPSLIIADEPTTALDVSIEAQILNELLELRDEFNVSVMLITHDLAVIRETSDRVAVMYAGEIMERSNVGELFDHPEHPYTQGLLSSIPRIDDDREWLDIIEGSVPDMIDKPSGCPFRNRCQYAFELCEQPLVTYDVSTGQSTETYGEHIARCHLHNDHVQRDEDGHAIDVDNDALVSLEERLAAEGKEPATQPSLNADGGRPIRSNDDLLEEES
ncbi:MAG: ABC transporter ATP-binding protein [Halobacteriales archaeon]